MKFFNLKNNLYLISFFNVLLITLLFISIRKNNYTEKQLEDYRNWLYENTFTGSNLYVANSSQNISDNTPNSNHFTTVLRVKRNHCSTCIDISLKIVALLQKSNNTNSILISTDIPKSLIIEKLKNYNSVVDNVFFNDSFVRELEISNVPYFFKFRESDMKVVNIVLSEWKKEELTTFCVQNFLD